MTIEELERRMSLLNDRTLRYQYIIQLGKKLPPMAPELRTEEHRVPGCMSPAWLRGGRSEQDPAVLEFVGDSDSIIVKGLFAILASIYNGRSPEAALAVDVSDVFERLRLGEALSPNRRNGFYSMVSRMRSAAASLA